MGEPPEAGAVKATSILRVLPLEVLRVAVTPVGCPGTTAAGHGRVSNERKNERGGTGAHRGRRGRRAPRGTPQAGALHPRSHGAHLLRAARCGFDQSCSGKPGAVVCRQAVAPASTGGCACVGAVVRAAEAVGGAPLGSGPAALARAALARPPPPRGTAGVCGWRPVLRCRRASPPAISPAISGSCHTASQPAARGPGCASLGGASASRCSTHATKPSAAAVRSRV